MLIFDSTSLVNQRAAIIHCTIELCKYLLPLISLFVDYSLNIQSGSRLTQVVLMFPLQHSPRKSLKCLPSLWYLQVLMNKVLNTPHDPYVTIDHTFWPPYVELLLRHGIAVRHQENNFKLRLETFFWHICPFRFLSTAWLAEVLILSFDMKSVKVVRRLVIYCVTVV